MTFQILCQCPIVGHGITESKLCDNVAETLYQFWDDIYIPMCTSCIKSIEEPLWGYADEEI